MSAPIRPEPESWLVRDARSRIDPTAGRQLGPDSPFAPADATARRLPPPQKSLADVLRTLRVTAGGVTEGVARIPTDIAALATLPITAIPRDYELRTVGRGRVVSQPRTSPPRLAEALDKVLARGEAVAGGLGDHVGGVPQTESEQDFRDMGSFVGNMAAWERLPALWRNRQFFVDMFKLPPRDFIGGEYIPHGQGGPSGAQGWLP